MEKMAATSPYKESAHERWGLLLRRCGVWYRGAHSGGGGRRRAEKHSKHDPPGPRLEDGRNHHPNGCTRHSGWLLTSEDLPKSANGDKANHPPHGDPGAPSLTAAPLFSAEQLKENSRHSRFAGSGHLTCVLTQKWERAGLGGPDMPRFGNGT